ncbi:MAG: diphosphomevalonate decarboxylase [Gammaproteobacteria bacterium]|nr:diphosphomevalonate decarboxylase [Gammaproteobacteria bacterium]
MSKSVTRQANANIALVKYWGKRGAASLNLPAVGSLSVTLDGLATTTTVSLDQSLTADVYVRAGRERPEEGRRASAFLDRLRDASGTKDFCRIETDNNFPTAAGLASSASGFAALTLAASELFELGLDDRALSQWARQGSGSAGRSIFGGFVLQHRGEREDGEDCFAEQLRPASHWPLKVLVGVTDARQKATGSSDGMRQTAESSPYFQAWQAGQPADLAAAREAIEARDFDALASITEQSCLKMHATAMAANPGVIYWNAATLELIEAVRDLRQKGHGACFTIDAGPQVKVVCQPEAAAAADDMLRAHPGVAEVISCDLREEAS